MTEEYLDELVLQDGHAAVVFRTIVLRVNSFSFKFVFEALEVELNFLPDVYPVDVHYAVGL